MQELPERRPIKIDLNLLPPEYLPQKTPKLTIILIIAAIVLACIPWPFLIMKSSVDAENEDLEAQLNTLKLELQQKTAKVAECNALDEEIALLEEQLAALESDYEAFQDMIYIWSVIFDDIMQLPKGGGGILGDIDQSGTTISLEGSFTREKYVYEYTIMLEETGHFIDDGVIINSIKKSGEGGSAVYTFDITAELKGGAEQ